jgi:hypothetical protein
MAAGPVAVESTGVLRHRSGDDQKNAGLAPGGGE